MTNFGPRPVPVPRGTVVVASGPLQDGLLHADTTVWIIPRRSGHEVEISSCHKTVRSSSGDGGDGVLGAAAAWRPARRPEKTQSARDRPLT